MDVRSISKDYYFQKMDLMYLKQTSYANMLHVWAYILKNLQYTVAGNCN